MERLKRMEYFESQDFDPVENDVERATQLARDQSEYAAEEGWRWIMSGMFRQARLSFNGDMGNRLLVPGDLFASGRTCDLCNRLLLVLVRPSTSEMACVCAVLIGGTMGFCSFCVDVGLETLNNWKFGSVKQVNSPRSCLWCHQICSWPGASNKPCIQPAAPCTC